MCKAPKPPKSKEPKKPMFLRNKYLDEFIGDAQAVSSLKQGRGSLRIVAGSETPSGGRNPGESLAPASGTAPSTTIAPRPIAPRNRGGRNFDRR